MQRFRLTIIHAAIVSGFLVALCLSLTLTVRGSSIIDVVGWTVLYLLGLAWSVFLVEQSARRIEIRKFFDATGKSRDMGRPQIAVGGEVRSGRRGGNPLDPAAWYYGRQSQRLRQSIVLLATYSMMFVLIYMLAHLRFGKQNNNDGYELPAGGGSDTIKASAVKVQKVIRKKYVINPYSSIIFSAPPPLDQIDVKLAEETQNRYQVGEGDGATGDGDGEGSGFGSGTGKGKAAFVRLKHGDRGWDRNFGIGGDLNMLAEYHLRTKQKVAEETEYVEADQLSRMPAQKNPPLLYISGSQSLPLSAADKKNLQQYLTERHGMILGDNHGGPGFHNHFIAMMNEITGVTPVTIARDDRIHQRPYAIPQLPIVVAHGGTTPLGWKIDGRWVVYYHPGALSDAWRDDHAGIKKDVYESCYQLGVNIIFYSLQEKNKWLKSQKP